MPSGSGDFKGHAVPAVFFFGFGSFFLLLTLKRCRDLNNINRLKAGDEAVTFGDAHIPENPTVLRNTGILLMACTTAGAALEVYGALSDGLGFFHQLAHQALYLCFFFVGAVACLEAKRLLFPDASRVALAFAFLLQYVLWNEHGLMKDDPSDRRVHILQAQINLVAFFAFGYSVYNPKSLLVYVISWAVMILNATWMFTAGLTAWCLDLMTHTVGAALALEALFIAAVLIVCTAIFLPEAYDQSAARKEKVGRYHSLLTDDEATALDGSLELELENNCV